MSLTTLVLTALCSALALGHETTTDDDKSRLLQLVNKYNSAVTSAALTKDTTALFATFAENVTITSYYNDGEMTKEEGVAAVQARFNQRIGALKQINYETPYEVFVHPAFNRIAYTTMISTVGDKHCTAYSKLVVETMFDNNDQIVQIIQFFDSPAFRFHSLLEPSGNDACDYAGSKATRYQKALTAFTRSRIDLYYATHSDATVDGAKITMDYFYHPEMRGEFGGPPVVGTKALEEFLQGMFSVIEYSRLEIYNVDVIASGLHATYIWKLAGQSKHHPDCMVYGTTRLIVELSHFGQYKLAREYTVGVTESIGACMAMAEAAKAEKEL